MFIDTKKSRLRNVAARGAVWLTVGYGLSQAFRLLSNLVLARFLTPEDFGVMAIVSVIMMALNMFSDIGLGPSIIKSQRANDITFLNTAWSIQVIRGFVLFCICLIISYPTSVFYDKPDLIYLIAVMGFTAMISGFNSTGIYTSYKDIRLSKLIIIELVSQLCAIVTMIGIAIFHATVWVFVFGAIISAAVKMLLSQKYLSEEINNFAWEKESLNDLVGFGKWIFFSTVLAFFINSSGSMILGKLVTFNELGLFSIGATLAKSTEKIYSQLSNKLLLPIYAKIKDQPINEIRIKVFKIKLVLLLVFLPMILLLLIFGQNLIQLLFDERYHDSGWIFQVFLVGFLPILISGIGPFYLTLGKSKLYMMLTVIKFIVFVSSMSLGWNLLGSDGVIIGMATYSLFYYFVDIYVQYKHDIWIWKIDFPAIIISVPCVYLAFT